MIYLKAPASHDGSRSTAPRPPIINSATLQPDGTIEFDFDVGASALGVTSLSLYRRQVGQTAWTQHATGISLTPPYTATGVTAGVDWEWAFVAIHSGRKSGLSNLFERAGLPTGQYLTVTLPTTYEDLTPLDRENITAVNVYYGLAEGDYTGFVELFGTAGGTVDVVTTADPQTWHFVVEIITDGGLGQSIWSDDLTLSLTGGGTVSVSVVTV